MTGDVMALPKRSRGYQSDDRCSRAATTRNSPPSALRSSKSDQDSISRSAAAAGAYILEEHGLGEGRLRRRAERHQRLPQGWRSAAGHLRRGRWPPFDHLEAGRPDPGTNAADIVGASAKISPPVLSRRSRSGRTRTTTSQMLVEKIDLKSLFSPVCDDFHIPIANATRLVRHELPRGHDAPLRRDGSQGQECVLLYCGDHDPVGLAISDFLRSNMAELSRAVGWSPAA